MTPNRRQLLLFAAVPLKAATPDRDELIKRILALRQPALQSLRDFPIPDTTVPYHGTF